MLNILKKEIKLSASVLTFLFVLFGFMFFIPGYPILCGVFFTTLGIYQSFQNARETNDILFSALLPVSKKDVVKGKYIFVCFIEFLSLILMAMTVILRMTVLRDCVAYRNNAMMNANFFALGLAFVIFGLYNFVFVGGFFKTVYKIGRPFLYYIIAAFLMIAAGEALHHFPNLQFFNSFGTENLVLQLSLLVLGMLTFALFTYISYCKSCIRFEKIDL